MDVPRGIEVRNLSKRFARSSRPALDGVSFEVHAGEALGIIGPNGAGKTTLMGCLAGLLRPDAGQITIAGESPQEMTVRCCTGYVPERLVCDRWMTGYGFLRYHHALAGRPRNLRGEEASEALSRVGLCWQEGKKRVARYSKGMLQRLGLAQALLGTPHFLLLDEPLSGVDPSGARYFRELLLELQSAGVTLVINSHQLDEVERVCDRVAFLRAGKLESVLTLRTERAGPRLMTVSWTDHSPGIELSVEGLSDLAKRAEAHVVGVEGSSATFSVGSDAGVARLVASLVGAGLQVIAVGRAEQRLEDLFVRDPEDRESP